MNYGGQLGLSANVEENEHVPHPCVVDALCGKRVIELSIGESTGARGVSVVVTITDEGEVCAWGGVHGDTNNSTSPPGGSGLSGDMSGDGGGLCPVTVKKPAFVTCVSSREVIGVTSGGDNWVGVYGSYLQITSYVVHVCVWEEGGN